MIFQLTAIKQNGAITINEQGKSIAPLDKTTNNVIAFSDDGKDMQDNDIMKQAMLTAKSLNKIVVAHNDEVDESSGSTPSSPKRSYRNVPRKPY